MTHYSNNPNECRVDFFKEHGKWYATEMVKFNSINYRNHPMYAFAFALQFHFENGIRYEGMIAICLEPYVEFQFPLMLRVSEKELERLIDAYNIKEKKDG